jgi:hypothetical protein
MNQKNRYVVGTKSINSGSTIIMKACIGRTDNRQLDDQSPDIAGVSPAHGSILHITTVTIVAYTFASDEPKQTLEDE